MVIRSIHYFSLKKSSTKKLWRDLSLNCSISFKRNILYPLFLITIPWFFRKIKVLLHLCEGGPFKKHFYESLNCSKWMTNNSKSNPLSFIVRFRLVKKSPLYLRREGLSQNRFSYEFLNSSKWMTNNSKSNLLSFIVRFRLVKKSPLYLRREGLSQNRFSYESLISFK